MKLIFSFKALQKSLATLLIPPAMTIPGQLSPVYTNNNRRTKKNNNRSYR
jgi:hypothetical protein